jgi:hypothetical protein
MGEWIKGAPHPLALLLHEWAEGATSGVVLARGWAENKKTTLADGSISESRF